MSNISGIWKSFPRYHYSLLNSHSHTRIRREFYRYYQVHNWEPAVPIAFTEDYMLTTFDLDDNEPFDDTIAVFLDLDRGETFLKYPLTYLPNSSALPKGVEKLVTGCRDFSSDQTANNLIYDNYSKERRKTWRLYQKKQIPEAILIIYPRPGPRM